MRERGWGEGLEGASKLFGFLRRGRIAIITNALWSPGVAAGSGLYKAGYTKRGSILLPLRGVPALRSERGEVGGRRIQK